MHKTICAALAAAVLFAVAGTAIADERVAFSNENIVAEQSENG